MGYFDRLADNSFSKDSQGRDIFYPKGYFGKGFILESQEQHAKAYSAIKKVLKIGLLSGLLLCILIGFFPEKVIYTMIFSWFLTSTTYYIVVSKNISKNLAATNENLKMSAVVDSKGLMQLFLAEFLSLVFIGGALYLFYYDKQNATSLSIVGIVICIILFGLIAIVNGYAIITKIRNRFSE